MAHHTITLNYGSAGFHPDQDDLPVSTGDTISFQLGVAPPQSTFKITMNDQQSFSPSESQDSETQIHVVKAVASSYRCQLFDASNTLISHESQGGGSVRPGSPAPAAK